MGHADSPIRHHNHQIPQAQLEARVPAHAQNDDLSVEVPSFEQIFDPDELLHLFIIPRHPRVCTRALKGARSLSGSQATESIAYTRMVSSRIALEETCRGRGANF